MDVIYRLWIVWLCGVRALDTEPVFEAAFQGQCEDVSNPCEHVCTNHSPRTYECSCRDGFQLAHNGYACLDLVSQADTPSASSLRNSLPIPDSLHVDAAPAPASSSSSPCASIVCVAGGVCAVDRVHGYRCLCPLGRAGQHCEQHVVINKPRFTGDSYAVLPLSTDWDYRLDLRLQLRAATENGLIFYSGETLLADRNFILLELVEGYVTLRMRMRQQSVNLQSRFKVPLGDSVPVHVGRRKNLFFLRVSNENKIATVVQELLDERLKATENIYLGGLPDMDGLPHDALVSRSGFVGCLLSLESNGKTFPLEPLPYGTIIAGINLERCITDACDGVQCLHDGQCIADEDNSPRCDCVVPYVGARCEIDLDSQLPMFNGTSYLLYDLSRNISLEASTELRVSFRPADVESGVLLHMGRQRRSAFSDALQIRLAAGHLQVAVDLGEGYSLARTQTPLQPGVWYTVSVLRSGRYLQLIVESGGDGADRQEILYNGAFSRLTLSSNAFYIGGLDYDDVGGDDAQPSFHGCIDLDQSEFMGVKLKLSKARAAVNLHTCRSVNSP
ncbi:pikachurin-like [Paramacrobiotus metropolitanus]|uniref:pikachurin-like n=1 Tax=Paramacrobiotus metropolitanus TaxID=2943436 RepID=UPI0024464A0D|nr:pikachurin-like [Paramacrobiotus metropolitanus]